ncbi:MAG: hypothetical protein RMJ98_10895 [Myxococcales bacterium]|nr:hypothetical protein [Polyangiaceae bacterium]MDW8249793.1 hypothetical protein [Myxococcales bacterium]
MPRLHLLPWLALLLTACEDRPPTTVVVALSSEAPIPQGVQSVTIQVKRGGTTYFDETYHVVDKNTANTQAKTQLTVDDIPGTLLLQDDGRGTGPVSVTVEATLLTAGGVTRKTLRSATTSFVQEKQKLLRMPIQLACSDVTCPNPGETCRAGRCLPDTVPESELEDFEEAKARPVAGQCFQYTSCREQQGSSEVRIPIETVVEVLGEDCTIPYLFPGLIEGDSELEGVTDPNDPRLAKLRNSINMGYIWSGAYNIANEDKDEKSGSWTVVDRDPVEGWEFANLYEATRQNPEATRRATLTPGLCAALKLDRDAIRAAQEEAKKTGQP